MSKRSKACEITPEIRRAVEKRDGVGVYFAADRDGVRLILSVGLMEDSE